MFARLLSNKTFLTVLFFGTVFFSLSLQAQKWEGIDAGTTSSRNIQTLAVDSAEDKLVIGGVYLNEVNGTPSSSLYKWNPENGVEILAPNDVDSMPVTFVRDIYFKGDSMVVLGAGGMAIHYNQTWSVVDTNYVISPYLFDIYSYNGQYLIASGNGETFYNKPIGRLVLWDGDTTFTEFENISDVFSSSGWVVAVKEYKNEIYVAGNASSGVMQEIMRWNGSAWTDVGGGIYDVSGLGGPNAMAIYKGDLYVGGMFYQQDHSMENHIARWDGEQWLSVGGGIGDAGYGTGTIHDLYVHDGYLYAVGAFLTAGGVPAKNIARWDGEQLCGCGTEFHGEITGITHYRDTLYVAGSFNNIDGDTIHKIARFIGDTFADTCGSIDVSIPFLSTPSQHITAYPNPATDHIVLEISETKNEQVTITLYNRLGQKVRTTTATALQQQLTLEIADLPVGVYFVHLLTSTTAYSTAFIKQ